MKNLEIINYISIIVIIISLFFIGVKLTGYVTTDTESGIVNVTIATSGALNFTTTLLDFGSGAVDGGASGATLNTSGDGAVTDGTWSTQNGQLVLENIGNVNVSLNLSANKTAADFIGGTNPTFKAIVTNSEANSCSGTQYYSSAIEINTTSREACGVFEYDDDRDTINIDFELYIPNNAEGAKTVGILAVGTY